MPNWDIKGVEIGGTIMKFAQYADYLWTPMTFDQKSPDAMFWELHFFQSSGCEN